MEIPESQTDRQSLERFGQEATALLLDRNFQTMAERFGYAFSYDREPASAIEADLLASFNQEGEFPNDIAPTVTIKYFNADAMESTGLVAAVECITHIADGSAVLLALVVTGKGSRRLISLEGIDRVR